MMIMMMIDDDYDRSDDYDKSSFRPTVYPV